MPCSYRPARPQERLEPTEVLPASLQQVSGRPFSRRWSLALLSYRLSAAAAGPTTPAGADRAAVERGSVPSDAVWWLGLNEQCARPRGAWALAGAQGTVSLTDVVDGDVPTVTTYVRDTQRVTPS